ncbi:MAG: hypothetical protein Q8Q35_00615 [Nanoarchaeota archaeon]|nr:hypothetical protein [Nanoarchaeota archaeon]
MPLPKQLLRKNKKEQIQAVLECIKSNPGCTVTDIYNITSVWPAKVLGSIKEAYNLAKVEYPQCRNNMSSSVNSAIRKRAYAFEDTVIDMLKTNGKVTKYYRTKYGVADALVEVDEKRYIIEIKDYRSKNNITLSEIKQANRYIEGTKNCFHGIIITHPESKGKRSKVYIDGNEISIISYKEIYTGL